MHAMPDAPPTPARRRRLTFRRVLLAVVPGLAAWWGNSELLALRPDWTLPLHEPGLWLSPADFDGRDTWLLSMIKIGPKRVKPGQRLVLVLQQPPRRGPPVGEAVVPPVQVEDLRPPVRVHLQPRPKEPVGQG
jgi:hypothetical protein